HLGPHGLHPGPPCHESARPDSATQCTGLRPAGERKAQADSAWSALPELHPAPRCPAWHSWTPGPESAASARPAIPDSIFTTLRVTQARPELDVRHSTAAGRLIVSARSSVCLRKGS